MVHLVYLRPQVWKETPVMTSVSLKFGLCIFHSTFCAYKSHMVFPSQVYNNEHQSRTKSRFFFQNLHCKWIEQKQNFGVCAQDFQKRHPTVWVIYIYIYIYIFALSYSDLLVLAIKGPFARCVLFRCQQWCQTLTVCVNGDENSRLRE